MLCGAVMMLFSGRGGVVVRKRGIHPSSQNTKNVKKRGLGPGRIFKITPRLLFRESDWPAVWIEWADTHRVQELRACRVSSSFSDGRWWWTTSESSASSLRLSLSLTLARSPSPRRHRQFHKLKACVTIQQSETALCSSTGERPPNEVL